MVNDVTSLVREDHDQLDHMLLVLAAASPAEAFELFDRLQTRFAAHVFAQTFALRDVLGPAPFPRALAMIVRKLEDEHRNQARALAAIALASPGTRAWVERTLELHALVLDHATREEHMRASLEDHVSGESRRVLSDVYSTVRAQRLLAADTQYKCSA